MKLRHLFAASLAVLLCAGPVAAQETRWIEVGKSPVPLNYYQGMTHDEAGNRYFTGVWFGLYRTDPSLRETGRNDDVIPPEVRAREGYNHVGDLSYAAGQLYLPLECYYPPLGNTCNTGSIGIADPDTLQLEYYVKLDPSEIAKAMWNEVSPDGELLWTQSGRDLLAYATADLTEANAAPAAAPIEAVRRLPNAVPPEGITGATFIGDDLFVAGQDESGGVIWSIDLATGARTFEMRTDYVGESEGLDDDFDLSGSAAGLPGSLHYMVMPYNESAYPTNGPTKGVIYHYDPKPVPSSEETVLTFTGGSARTGQYTDEARFEIRLEEADGDPIEGATVNFSMEGTTDAQTATTGPDGLATAAFRSTQRPDEYLVTASFSGTQGEHEPSMATHLFTVMREDSVLELSYTGHGSKRPLEAVLFDADDRAGSIGGRTIAFYANGSWFGSETTDASGTARMSIPARYRGARHTFEARFEGDEFFKPSADQVSA